MKNQTKSILKEILITNDNSWVDNNSASAKWYKNATDFIPHGITKHTSRKLATTIHRLRLGYKANWQIVANDNRACDHCNQDTDVPLIHYLLECPETQALHSNTTPYNNLQREEAFLVATRLALEITQNTEIHAHTLLRLQPR